MIKNYSDWRVKAEYRRGLFMGYMVYRLTNVRKGERPGNVVIYDVKQSLDDAEALADAINGACERR